MKKILLLLLIISTVSCDKKNGISYTVTHTTNDSIPALNIEMSFKANKSGETVLVIQNEVWGQNDLFNTIFNLNSKQATEIIKQRDSGWIVLKHPKGIENIQLHYTLKQDFEGPFVYTNFYRPIIQENYFHLLSHSTFMLPKEYVSDNKPKFDVQIEWVNFNTNYSIVNSFGSNLKTQKIKNTHAEEFHHAIFTGGDYKTFDLDINNKKVTFSIRGKWETINESEIASYLKKTIQIQRDFWKDHTQNYYAIIITPSFLKQGSALQGTRITNSFATGISNNKDLKLDELIKLFNHELMHNWIGGVITYESNKQYWFSEGFTEYFALKNIAKNKIGTLDESFFIKELNGYIQRLFISSAKEVPNNEIMTHYWDDHEYNRLPYRRGVVFAFYLDNKIREDSKGEKNLDDLMLELKRHAIDSNQVITHKHFLKVANTFLNNDLTLFFDKHIEKGIFFDLPKMFEDFKYDFNTDGIVFDLGFTYDKSNKLIADIDVKSNAYKSGLRKGDRIVSRSVSPGNPNYKAKFKVLKNGKKIPYTFFPSKEAPLPSLLDNSSNIKRIISLKE